MDGRRGWVIGRVAGAPVVVQPSVLVMVALLTVAFVPTVRLVAPALADRAPLGAFLVVVVLLVSAFLHEVAHALVARARGLEVRELALTVWGGHTQLVDGRTNPATSALVALAGPAINLALAVASWLVFQAQAQDTVPALLLYLAAYANAAIGLANLLPGLPLDGGQVAEAAVWASTGSRATGTRVAAGAGRVIGVLVVVVVIAVPAVRGGPVNLLLVVWASCVGVFLWVAASQALDVGLRRERLDALDVRRLALPVVVADAGATVAEVRALRRADSREDVRVVLTMAGSPVGYLDVVALDGVADAVAASTPVWALGTALPPGVALDARLRGRELHAAASAAARTTAMCPVVEVGDDGGPGSVVGLLRVSDLARAVHLD